MSVIIDAGTLEFSDEDLTATGLLVPFGVKCRSNIGEFEVASGVFTLPADTTGTSLNIEHAREDVVGGIAKAWEQPEGVMSTFRFAATDEGRQAYAEAKSGKRKHLSAEVAKVRILDGKATGGRLFAAALVTKPAFEGATLLAAEDTELASDPYTAPEASSSSQYVTEYTDANGVKWRRIEENTSTTTVTKITDPTEGEDTEEEGGSTVTAAATTEPVTAPVVPSTFLGSAPKAPPAAAPEIDLGTVFAAMAAVKAGMAPDAETLLAALSDIKVEAAGGLTGASSGILQPAWVGKLWQGRRYQRKYLDLCTHLFGGIQLGGRKGFKLNQGTALVAEWAGNKTDVASGTASTSLTSSSRKAYGYAADVAREWYDLEGGGEVLQAFFEGVTDSYAKVTDEAALATIFLTASRTAAPLDRLIAPQVYPSVAGHDYPAAMGMVIQLIEAISDGGDDASFAIVNDVAWRQLLFTPKELIPEYVTFAVGAGTGEGTSDGKVKIVKAPQSFFTGTIPTNPQVMGGAKNAIEFREQGQTPIQIDALDIAKGGVDKAIIGYLETFVVRSESLALIGTKP